MFTNEGPGLTYAVVTDELLQASSAVSAVTQSAKDATIETLPSQVSVVGHGRLEVSLRDFCARWDNGLSHLVGDSETMAHRLQGCAQNYLENEDETQGAYQQATTSCTAPTPPAGAPRIAASPDQAWLQSTAPARGGG